jgi:hypothetical protein
MDFKHHVWSSPGAYVDCFLYTTGQRPGIARVPYKRRTAHLKYDGPGRSHHTKPVPRLVANTDNHHTAVWGLWSSVLDPTTQKLTRIGTLVQCSTLSTDSACTAHLSNKQGVVVENASGQWIGNSLQPSFSTQGVPCTAKAVDRRRYNMVLFTAGQATDAQGSPQNLGIRALMETDALGSHASNYLYRCERSRPSKLALAAQANVPRDAFQPGEMSQGRETANKCYRDHLDPTIIYSPDCGNSYTSYAQNSLCAPDLVLVEDASTGVAGGGEGEALVPTSVPFREMDDMLYRDPDVPCTRYPSARWAYGRFTLGASGDYLYGWVIQRDPDTADPRQCPH